MDVGLYNIILKYNAAEQTKQKVVGYVPCRTKQITRMVSELYHDGSSAVGSSVHPFMSDAFSYPTQGLARSKVVDPRLMTVKFGSRTSVHV